MPSLVVMGVSGCGKSLVAAMVAERLALPLIEGDAFHSETSRARMQAGVPLTDLDRASWLERLGSELQRHPAGAVLTCSALKRSYRDALRAASPGLRFAWLDLTPDAARSRVARRPQHFFPASLVTTQFEALEAPLDEADTLRVDALRSPAEICEAVLGWMDEAQTSVAPRA